MTPRRAAKTANTTTRDRALSLPGEGQAADTGEFLRDRVYDMIHRDIIGCDLEPGGEVTESSLSERYGFGKAPIRTALVRLENQGLIKTLPRRGYLITPVTMKHVQDVFRLRMMLEPAATELAAGHLDIDRLTKLNKIIRVAYAPTDYPSKHRFFDARREFQGIIARASDNEMLARVLCQCYDEFMRCFHVGLLLHLENIGAAAPTDARKYPYGSRLLIDLGEATDEMVEALRQEDGDRARLANVRKIESSQTFIVNAIRSSRRIAETSISMRSAS